MASITLEDAQATLPELIAGLGDSGDVLIESGGRAVAKLTAAAPKKARRRAGSAKGILTILEDDDAHLAEVRIESGVHAVAKLTAAESSAAKRKLGTMRGSVLYVAPDFDAVPEGTAGESAAVIPRPSRTSWPCQPGTAKNTTWMAPDFDTPMGDFTEAPE